MKTIIVRGFKNMIDSGLCQMAHNITNSVTDNPHYPDAGDVLQKVKTAAEAFDNSLKTPLHHRNANDTLQKNENRIALENNLSLLFNYIIYKAGNDLTILTSSGFPLAKERTQPKGNAQPTNFKVTGGNEAGTMLMQCKKVVGSEAYFYQYKQMPDADMSEWHTVQNKSNSLLITKLTSGAKYSFRMASVGPETGRGQWSEMITRFVP